MLRTSTAQASQLCTRGEGPQVRRTVTHHLKMLRHARTADLVKAGASDMSLCGAAETSMPRRPAHLAIGIQPQGRPPERRLDEQRILHAIAVRAALLVQQPRPAEWA